MCGAHGERGILHGGVCHPPDSRRSLWLPRFDSGGGAVGRGKRRIRVDHSLQLRRLKEGGGRTHGPATVPQTHTLFFSSASARSGSGVEETGAGSQQTVSLKIFLFCLVIHSFEGGISPPIRFVVFVVTMVQCV